MPTEKQLADRQSYIGASDISALFGLNRFRNAHDVWLEKTGRVEPENLDEKQAVKAGKHFEAGVLEEAKTVLGPLRKNVERRIKGTCIKVHMDALVTKTAEPVEVKVEGLFGPLREGWGDVGTDQVPYDVLLQGLTQAESCEADIGHVWAFLGGRGFVSYRFGYDAELVKRVIERAQDFWENNVVKDIPPAEVPHIDFLKRTKRTPTVAMVPVEILRKYRFAKEALAKAEDTKKQVEAELIVAMSGAEKTLGVDGEYKYSFTYKTQQRTGIDSERLKNERPEIAAEFVKTSTFNRPYWRATPVK